MANLKLNFRQKFSSLIFWQHLTIGQFSVNNIFGLIACNVFYKSNEICLIGPVHCCLSSRRHRRSLSEATFVLFDDLKRFQRPGGQNLQETDSTK